MDDTLIEIKEVLNRGAYLNGQGSYERRAPSQEAVPFLLRARNSLVRLLEEQEPTEEIWRLLSQAEEYLLHYGAARRCLERAMAVSGKRDKKDLKKLALLSEHKDKWKELRLSPDELRKLGKFLNEKMVKGQLHRNFKWTLQWLEEHNISKPDEVIEGLRNHGGYDDFLVLANVVIG